MPRNLFERCEVVFPVRDPLALARIHGEILPAYMADTVKARLQQADGTYLRASKVLKDAPVFCAQDFLMQLAEGKVEMDAIPSANGFKTVKKVTSAKADAAD
jgi:polyphosphate kinase